MRAQLALVAVLALGGCAGTVQWAAIARSPGGSIRFDMDGDGFGGPWQCQENVASCDAAALNAKPIANLDCNDRDKRTYPGAPDTPGDGIDEDCDGADGMRAALPPPTPNAP